MPERVKCARCGGSVVKDGEGLRCLSCGRAPEGREAAYWSSVRGVAVGGDSWRAKVSTGGYPGSYHSHAPMLDGFAEQIRDYF